MCGCWQAFVVEESDNLGSATEHVCKTYILRHRDNFTLQTVSSCLYQLRVLNTSLWRSKDFLLGAPTRPFGENVCENERTGSGWGSLDPLMCLVKSCHLMPYGYLCLMVQTKHLCVTGCFSPKPVFVLRTSLFDIFYSELFTLTGGNNGIETQLAK